MVEGPVDVEEGVVVDNFVIDVGVAVVEGSDGLGFVGVVVVADNLIRQNGLLQWRGNRLG